MPERDAGGADAVHEEYLASCVLVRAKLIDAHVAVRSRHVSSPRNVIRWRVWGLGEGRCIVGRQR